MATARNIGWCPRCGRQAGGFFRDPAGVRPRTCVERARDIRAALGRRYRPFPFGGTVRAAVGCRAAVVARWLYRFSGERRPPHRSEGRDVVAAVQGPFDRDRSRQWWFPGPGAVFGWREGPGLQGSGVDESFQVPPRAEERLEGELGEAREGTAAVGLGSGSWPVAVYTDGRYVHTRFVHGRPTWPDPPDGRMAADAARRASGWFTLDEFRAYLGTGDAVPAEPADAVVSPEGGVAAQVSGAAHVVASVDAPDGAGHPTPEQALRADARHVAARPQLADPDRPAGAEHVFSGFLREPCDCDGVPYRHTLGDCRWAGIDLEAELDLYDNEP